MNDLYLQSMISAFHSIVAPAYAQAADELRDRGQREAAIIVSHVARRISQAATREELREAVEEAHDLTKWLPLEPEFRGLGAGARKDKLIESIKASDLEPDSKEFYLRALVRPGRPPETRFLVIEARQLHKQGLDWPEVERRLFAERLHSTGRSIDREVELFENTLKRYGVKIDT